MVVVVTATVVVVADVVLVVDVVVWPNAAPGTAAMPITTAACTALPSRPTVRLCSKLRSVGAEARVLAPGGIRPRMTLL